MIAATAGESIVSTTINVTCGFNDLRQPRISGPLLAIPESGTYLLIGAGSGLLGILGRRRRV